MQQRTVPMMRDTKLDHGLTCGNTLVSASSPGPHSGKGLWLRLLVASICCCHTVVFMHRLLCRVTRKWVAGDAASRASGQLPGNTASLPTTSPQKPLPSDQNSRIGPFVSLTLFAEQACCACPTQLLMLVHCLSSPRTSFLSQREQDVHSCISGCSQVVRAAAQGGHGRLLFHVKYLTVMPALN